MQILFKIEEVSYIDFYTLHTRVKSCVASFQKTKNGFIEM